MHRALHLARGRDDSRRPIGNSKDVLRLMRGQKTNLSEAVLKRYDVPNFTLSDASRSLQ